MAQRKQKGSYPSPEMAHWIERYRKLGWKGHLLGMPSSEALEGLILLMEIRVMLADVQERLGRLEAREAPDA